MKNNLKFKQKCKKTIKMTIFHCALFFADGFNSLFVSLHHSARPSRCFTHCSVKPLVHELGCNGWHTPRDLTRECQHASTAWTRLLFSMLRETWTSTVFLNYHGNFADKPPLGLLTFVYTVFHSSERASFKSDSLLKVYLGIKHGNLK